jgi:phosphonoacetate hydrolase
MRKVMIFVIDGCNPDYLTKESAPNIFRLSQKYGFSKTVQCAMPSVTNVNHACILSGKWPEETKIVGNYFYNPITEQEGFIEERGYMKAKTILQHYQEMKGKTALLTVKGKVLGVYGDGADIGVSAQSPDETLLQRYGLEQPPAIDRIEATDWIAKAAYHCIKKDSPDFVYCTTNDYIFHHFAPGTREAGEQVKAIDRYIEKIAILEPQRQIYITADHGMNQKTRIVNFQIVSNNAGFDVYCLPPLKDRYIENHIYQEGGMLYVYLKNPSQAEKFYHFAKKQPYIEQVLTKEEASKKYHLPITQIGDYVLLTEKDSAFGECEQDILYTKKSRTHGSIYEREVPLIALNPEKAKKDYEYSKDIIIYLYPSTFPDVLGRTSGHFVNRLSRSSRA